ncbi:15596_t:CDS:1, partial [Gigaspora rosea]
TQVMMKDLEDETVLESREMSTTTRIYQEESNTVRSTKRVGINVSVSSIFVTLLPQHDTYTQDND